MGQDNPVPQQPDRLDAGTQPGIPAAADAQCVRSTVLLNGRSSVAIDHEGTRYVLRATRTGKLILTK